MRHCTAALTAAVLVAPTFLAAQGRTFQVPENCTPVMTVQTRACTVSNFWTCDGESDGDMWRADSGQRGPFYLSRTDSEAQWVESFGLVSGTAQTLKQPSADPASFSDLVENGLDAYDFVIVDQEGAEERVVGFDQLTGEETEIDGEPLLVTEFAARITEDDELVYAVEGQQYISLRHRVFFSGVDTSMRPDEEPNTADRTPVSFAYPGEPGFLAATPVFGCNATDIALRP
ncbi:MAG: hypothetical protein AAFX45_03905 [Pseudomonadota bacterium]